MSMRLAPRGMGFLVTRMNGNLGSIVMACQTQSTTSAVEEALTLVKLSTQSCLGGGV